jgi:hypothetical protein
MSVQKKNGQYLLFCINSQSRQELRIGADDDSSERVLELVLQCPNYAGGCFMAYL